LKPARLLVLIGALGLAGTALRPQIIGIGPVLGSIREDLGLSHAAAGGLAAVPVLCMGIMAPLAPRVWRRTGLLAAIGWGLAFVVLFGFTRAFAPTGATMLLLTIPLGLGMAVANALLPVAVKGLFPDRPLLGTGCYSVGILLGGTIAALAVIPLSDLLGDWRWSLAAMALASSLAVLAWLGLGRLRVALPTAPAELPALPWRSPVAWQLAALLALLAMSFYGLSAWLPEAYLEHGWQRSETARLLAVYNLAMIPAAVTLIVLGARMGSRRPTMVVAGVVLASSTVLLTEAPVAGYVWAALAGAAQSVLFTLVLTLPLDVGRNPREVSAVAGLMLGAGYTIGALAPFALGAARDLTGSFRASLWIEVLVGTLIVLNAASLGTGRLQAGLDKALTQRPLVR
jgi:CP family cyanate transporter-like MFS transporter